MKDVHRKAFHGVLVLAAGLGLFWCGWSTPPSAPESTYQSRVVVRPASSKVDGKVEATGGPGAYRLHAPSALKVKEPGWSDVEVLAEELGVVTTVRGEPGKSTLKLSLPGAEGLEVFRLPSKEKLKLKDGSLKLAPGQHELLVKAKAHIPDRLSLKLKPGEVRELKLALKKIPVPSLPVMARPPFPRPPQTRPYPRPAWPRPRPRPRPRFTPVPPAPQPARPVPAPMFTPIP